MRDLAAATPDLTRVVQASSTALLNDARLQPARRQARRATCSGSRGSTTPATRSSPRRTRTARSAAAWSCCRARRRSCWTRSPQANPQLGTLVELLNAPTTAADLPESTQARGRRLMVKDAPVLRQDRRDGAVRAVVLRAAAVPVARVRRPGAAEAEGLPLPHVVRRGRPARAGGRRADLRRAGRQGQDDRRRTSRPGRADVEIQLRLALRAAAVGREGDPAPEDAAGRDLRRAHARARTSAKPIPEGGALPASQVVRHGRARRDPAHVRPQDARGVPGLDADAGAGDRRATGATSTTRSATSAPFAEDTATIVDILNRQEGAVSRLIANTGVVFGALTERDGQLRSLIENSNTVFATTAARDERAAGGVPRAADVRGRVAQLTLDAPDRVRRTTTDPLVTQLRPAARELSPTLRGPRRDSRPTCKNLLEQLQPLIDASEKGFPAAEQTLEDAAAADRPARPGDRASSRPRSTSSALYKRELTSFFANTVAATQAKDPRHDAALPAHDEPAQPGEPRRLSAPAADATGRTRTGCPAASTSCRQGLPVYEDRQCVGVEPAPDDHQHADRSSSTTSSTPCRPRPVAGGDDRRRGAAAAGHAAADPAGAAHARAGRGADPGRAAAARSRTSRSAARPGRACVAPPCRKQGPFDVRRRDDAVPARERPLRR